ncbi:hypothetical protein [Pseudoalteromonas sp. MB47]|uniref:hypothetical protein n=1 Tax=Pseudoalteromonas sp. MB47 TaxID=2588452 RepID=UPI00140BE3F1|nr:hypothetical protein [Pseudoalteromonas sp. MB47]NHH90625.1 hypothetical protein [Pseudoalteromonas sp. MB47]
MFTNKKTLLAMSVASVFALSGCSSDDDKNEVVPDPVDPPVVVVPPEAPAELGAVVNANIVDNASFDVVPSTVMFYENGVASTSLVDENGNAVTSVTTEDGNFSFLLKDGADIDSVTAVVMADGYVQKTFSIDLAELSEGDVEVVLPLLSEESDGVAVEEASSNVSGGSSADAITGGVANGKATAAVTVPGGTLLQDANGDLITGDSVTLKVTAADTSSEAGAAVTPEGLNAGSTTTLSTPVGVASVEMVDSNGTKVKKFSQPITVSMAIPADKGVSTGDMLTLVSQNEDTGVWTTETQQVEVKDLIADGSFYNASFETDHLTFYAATVSSSACTDNSVTINFSETLPAGLHVIIASDSFNLVRARLLTEDSDSYTFSNARVAEGEGATFYVVNSATGFEWSSVRVEDVCANDANATITPEEVTFVNSTVTLQGTCDNSEDVVVGTGANVRYSVGNKPSKKATSNGDGTYSLSNLIEGQNYEVKVTYSGTLSSLNAGADFQKYDLAAGEDETFGGEISCPTTTGSGS